MSGLNRPPEPPVPPRPEPYRAVRTRRHLSLPMLTLITLLPALLVSAVIVWQHRGGPTDVSAFGAASVAEAAGATDARGDGATNSSINASATISGAGGDEPAAALNAAIGGLEGAAQVVTSPAIPSSPSAPAPRSLGIPAPEVSAAAAIVVDDASMGVLYGKDPYGSRPPASVTKMATAIVALERGRLDDLATSSLHFWNLAIEDGSTMGLEPGDQLTLHELLYGLMLVSGNDAAETLAEHISGTEEAFVAEMNALVARLGMTETHFTNAAGLSEPGHISSPWDLVLLGRYLMRFPDLREIVGTEQRIVRGLRDGQVVEFDLYNHNPLLNYTEGVDGLKTGFTEQSGRTIALTAERGGHRVYIVLMDTTLRAQDAIALVEWAFESHVWPGDAAPPSGATTAEATETATN